MMLAKDLDPSLKEYRFPDFGFNDELNYGSRPTNIWALLADHISSHPKYERIQNIVTSLNQHKAE